MKAEFDLVIRGGTVVTDREAFPANVGIKNGVIAALRRPDEAPLLGQNTIDAVGKHVLPGIIDCHVHFRQPGFEYKEDWTTGTMAAAFGGVTTVMEMPSMKPATDTVERFMTKRDLAESLAYVDFGLYALLSENSLPDIERLHEAGVTAFKCFLAAAPNHTPLSDGQLLEAFEALARTGIRCAIHAENGSIIEKRTGRLNEMQRSDAGAHAVSRPEVCAIEAVNRAIVFAEWTGAKIHIAHEGTAAAVSAISAAKARGVDVTVETCPQYLLLSVNDLIREGGILRCNPPLRDSGNQEQLWEAIRTEKIDIVSTDHAPHTKAEKLSHNIWECDCGMLGVETAVPLMLTEVTRGRLSISEYVRIAATNPAKVWRLYPQKGVIQPGSDADITIVDLTAPFEVDQEKLHSKNKISAWHRWSGRGVPLYTLVRGKIVVENGKLVGEPGWGRYVHQTPTIPTPRNVLLSLGPTTNSARVRA
ncbi:MAG: allantoinase AllB [Pseudolabrys sp.]|nr:allantoinase AllB [Pseudolabrys sp.]